MLALLATTPAQALQHKVYDAARHNRFSSGYPGAAPAPNGSVSYLGAGLDLSGIGWRTSDGTGAQAATLIAPSFFVGAEHFRFPVGSQISFRGADGVVRAYTVERQYFLAAPSGYRGDLMLHRLSAPIPAGDGVAALPVARLTSDADYAGLSALMYGKPARLGATVIRGVYLTGNYNDLPIIDRWGTNWASAGPDHAQAETGDSGSGAYVLVNGAPALVGTHTTTTGDTFVPGHLDELDAYLAAAGEQVTQVGAGAAAHATGRRLLVRYGGDYVSATQTSPARTGVVSTGNFDGQGDATDKRILSAHESVLSPAAANYSGPAYVGAIETIIHDSNPAGGTHNIVGVRENGRWDQINLQLNPGATGGQARALVLFPQSGFLSGAEAGAVSLDASGSLAIAVDNMGYASWRWAIRQGAQIYVSKREYRPGQIVPNTGTFALAGAQLLAEEWAPYDPAGGPTLNFDQGGASFAPMTFDNVTAAGFFVESDSLAANQALWVSEFYLTGTVKPRALWRETHFTPAERSNTAISGEAGDPDGDGVANLMEYALGGNPRVAGEAARVATETVETGGQRYLALRVPKNAAATDLTWSVEVSTDLVSWDGAPAASVTVSQSATEWLVRDATPLGAAARRFMRVRVQ